MHSIKSGLKSKVNLLQNISRPYVTLARNTN